MLTVIVTMDLRTYCLMVGGATVCVLTIAAFVVVIGALVHMVRGTCEPDMRKPEAITIYDSPRPTVSEYTPGPSPFMNPMKRRVRRAGRMRLRQHRRHTTLVMNPALPGECGFQCLPKAAGCKPTLPNVQWLRCRVAEAIRHARINDMVVAGVRVHDIIAQEGLTLEAYCRRVATTLWASKVELSLGADILGICVAYMDHKKAMVMGNGHMRYGIRLQKSHYMLVKLHKRFQQGNAPLQRAGMHQDWTSWQKDTPASGCAESAHCSEADHEDSEGYVTIKIMPNVSSFIRIMYVNGKGLSLADLKAKMSELLHLPVKLMAIMDDDGSEIPDWCGVPSNVTLTSTDTSTMVKLDVHVPQRKARFTIEVKRSAQRHDIEAVLSSILDVLPHFLEIKNNKGISWIPYGSLTDQSIFCDMLGRERGHAQTGHLPNGALQW